MSEVGVSDLRRDLKHWVGRVQAGDEVIITDRGKPVARLIGVAVPSALERLTAEGRVSQPRQVRPHARDLARISAHGVVSDYVIKERQARRA